MSRFKLKSPNLRFVLALLLAVVSTASLLMDGFAGAREAPRPAPEFTASDPFYWINAEPLTLEDLRGQVVLLDFWTFDCWNCYRSFPWLKSLEARYEDQGLRVIGVHTPEFAHEKVKANVVRKIEAFGLHHPVMMDNDYAYWRAIGNRYWPAFYLLDRQGRIRRLFIGETHADDPQARAIEAAIRELLAES